MERLMLIKLSAFDCAAQAWLNGVPLLRVEADGGTATLAVHEYVCSGANQLQLEIDASGTPAGQPRRLRTLQPRDGRLPYADCRLLLPRFDHAADESRVRTLGELSWHGEAGQRVGAPIGLRADVDLPIAFPRWRWLDAPVAQSRTELRERAQQLLEQLRDDLARGQTELYLQTCRLRSEELALAYQREVGQFTQELRDHLLHVGELAQWQWSVPESDALQLRAIAGGKLLECLDADGMPALRTQPAADGTSWRLPLRVAALEGKLYVLR